MLTWPAPANGTSDRRWLLADPLGSVIAVTNAAGAASGVNTYDEYGQPGASNTGRFQYTGAPWLAEAGLLHLRARAYDPALGRFLQTDPILTGGGLNLYAYVGNDPINAIDPSGLILVCRRVRVGDRITSTGGEEVVTPQFTNQCTEIGDRDSAGRGPRGGGERGDGGDRGDGGGNDTPPDEEPPRCLSSEDGPVFFEGVGVDLALVGGVGFGVYRFDVPSVGASGLVASGAGFLGFGGAAGTTAGQVDTIGNFLGFGWRIDAGLPRLSAAGGEAIFSNSRRLSGGGVTIGGGGGVYGGRTHTRLHRSNIPLCPN